MIPAQAIASLDAQLAGHGEDCILRRKEGSPIVDKDVAVRAFVRGLRAEELHGDAKQSWLKVSLSMTQILAAGWPAGHVVNPDAVDPRHPRSNDFIIVKGKQRQVMFADPIAMDDVVVRINLTVGG